MSGTTKRIPVPLLVMTIVMLLGTVVDASPVVIGSYLEIPVPRDASTGRDGPHRTLVAWQVDEGQWDEETLDGLEIIAVLESEGPLHEPTRGDVRATRVLIDRRATAAQEKALLAMAVALAPEHLQTIERIESVEVKAERETTRHAPAGTIDSVAQSDAVERHRWKLSVGRSIELELEVTENPDGCAGICGSDARPVPSVSDAVHAHDATPRSFRYNGVDVRADDIDRSGRPLAGAFSL